jgi:hypothetical protein
MEPIQIATSAVTLLVPYLVKGGESIAEKAGEAVWEKLTTLYQAIRNKLNSDKDDFAQQSLARLEQKPDLEARQRSLVDVLTEKIESDAEFAKLLSRLTQETTQDQSVGQFVTSVFGQAQVGKIINIGQATSVDID